MKMEIERFIEYLKREYTKEDLGYNKYQQLLNLDVNNLDMRVFDNISLKNNVYLLLETLITFGRTEKDLSQQGLALVLEKEMIKLLANQYLKSINNTELFQECFLAAEIMKSFKIAQEKDSIRIKCIPFLCHSTYMLQYYQKITGYDVFEVLGENYEEKYFLQNFDYLSKIEMFLLKYTKEDIAGKILLDIKIEGTYKYAKEAVLSSLKYYILDEGIRIKAEEEFLNMLNYDKGTSSANTNSKTSLILSKNGYLLSVFLVSICIVLGILIAYLVV